MGWTYRTCMHGVREELDWHDCPGCKAIAEALGKTWIDRRQTYIYMEMPEELQNVGVDGPHGFGERGKHDVD